MKRAFLGLIIFFLFPVFLLSASQAGSDCGREIRKAVEQGDIPGKINQLKKISLECRDSYSYHYELGKLLAQLGEFKPAEQALRDAAAKAPDGNERALADALAQLGWIFHAQDRKTEAVVSLRRSLELHPYPKVQSLLKDIEWHLAQKPMSAVQIKKSLQVSKSVDVEPHVNLRINFEFDRATLTKEGMAQAEYLGQALKDPVFEDMMFTLIGHTDLRGSAPYNQKLSERRSATVLDYLVRKCGVPVDRLKAIGRGKEEPLYYKNTEKDHFLNRRVEIVAK